MELHYSVLKNEVIEGLNIKPQGIYVDATIGYGGHALEILKRCPSGYLYGFDQDSIAIKHSSDKLKKEANNFEIIKANFANLKEELNKRNIEKIDGIIFDLGFSSPQIDDEKRGFSFMHDGPLDMRMDQESKISAKTVIDTYSQKELADIFYRYGEEKLSNVIAKKIKEEGNIESTLELTEVIKKAVGANYFYKYHPERKIFQALRIETNKELEVLEKTLPEAIEMLNKGGRICVITFHSLEDKITKDIFRKCSEVNDLVKGMPNIPEEYKPLIKLINRKPILPSESELGLNTRSHSAKLRIAERI